MAEVVQQQIEDRIPELEQLERVGIFTNKEIRSIIKKVSALEYKLHRRAVCKEDFINYAQYEINLLELIKKRRLRIGYFFKKDDIEYSIMQRIHRIFKRATTKWKSDLQLWLSHVAFCKKWNCKTQLSKLFSSMLAIHADKPALWIMAAKWEMEDRLSSESARHLFLRALRFHPESPKVFQEYFRMELMHAEKQRKEKQEIEQAKIDVGELEYSEVILSGELARIIYRDAIQKIKGAAFHIGLLSIVNLFEFAEVLQKEIIEDLQSLHANDPLTWDFMARQELTIDCLPSAEHISKHTKALDLDRKEQRCYVVYETAVTSLPTASMWKCFVTFCLERLKRKTNSEDIRKKRQDRLFSALHRAYESNLLEESLYVEWLHLLLELSQPETAVEIAAFATKQFSHSVEMWKTRLQVLIKIKHEDVPLRFEDAFKQVKTKDSLPLWILFVQWSEEAQSSDATEAIFQKAVAIPVPTVSVTMKEKYLDWAHRSSGYKKAKKVFASLYENRPFSLEFFTKMIQIETEQETCKMLNLREYYERALREFGSSAPGVFPNIGKFLGSC